MRGITNTLLIHRLIWTSAIAASTGLALALAGAGIWGFYAAALLTSPLSLWLVDATRQRNPQDAYRERRARSRRPLDRWL